MFCASAVLVAGCSNARVDEGSQQIASTHSEGAVVKKVSENNNSGNQVARDFNVAVLEEFEIAERRGTIDAYDLFARRHPKHPKADIARQRIKDLRVSRKFKKNDN